MTRERVTPDRAELTAVPEHSHPIALPVRIALVLYAALFALFVAAGTRILLTQGDQADSADASAAAAKLTADCAQEFQVSIADRSITARMLQLGCDTSAAEQVIARSQQRDADLLTTRQQLATASLDRARLEAQIRALGLTPVTVTAPSRAVTVVVPRPSATPSTSPSVPATPTPAPTHPSSPSPTPSSSPTGLVDGLFCTLGLSC